MAGRGRRGLSAREKQDLWRRWRSGQSLSDIGRALGKRAASIYGVLALTGGIAPPTRKRRATALSPDEREEISRGLAEGSSLRCIARSLGRAPSTISREIARNGGRKHYRAARGEQRFLAQAKRPKECLLATNTLLRVVVSERLAADWSPQQIAGWLAARQGGGSALRISHETIYRSLFVQARGVLKKELQSHLRTRRAMRRPKKITTNKPSRRTW